MNETTTDLSQLDVELELLEFIFKRNTENPDLYMLMIFGDEDIPIIIEDKLIFINESSLASSVLDTAPSYIREFAPPPLETTTLYNFPRMFHMVKSLDVDPDCTILNCLNLLLDFLYAFEIPLPQKTKEILYTFANHLTLNREFKSFLNESGISRGEAKEAIQWLMKQIFPRCMVLTSDGKIPLEEWMHKEQVTLY